MREFVAYPSRIDITLAAFAILAIFLFSLWMIGTFGEPPVWALNPPGFITAATWATAIGSGLGIAAAIGPLFDTRVQLRIGPAGVRWTRWSEETIPWSEIIDVTTYRFRSARYIVLHLRDPARFPRQGLPGWRLLAIADRTLTGGDICFSLRGTDRRFDDALSAIEYFRPGNP